jgi:triacylglycerol esterase/lipase EstA (alpha/beta hydrolase family)
MATIVTVHGTFASGPEEGEKWWQKGSEFTRHIGTLVEADGGTLAVQPHVWDGLNSERSRRNAGEALYHRLSTLDRNGEPVCVIGHSHGGSVIAAALMQSARRRDPLPRLGMWITVGTPFIRTER